MILKIKYFSKEGIVGEYSNYIGALIEQDAFVATSGLSIMDSYTFRPLYDGAGNAIQAEPYAGEMTENELIEKYGTSNVYTVYFVHFRNVLILKYLFYLMDILDLTCKLLLY